MILPHWVDRLGTQETGWRQEAPEAAPDLDSALLSRPRRMRDRALFDLAIDSKLRGCDLVTIKIGTLVTGHEIRTRAMVVQQKTGRPVQFEITTEVRASLLAWLQRRGGTVDDFAFPSRVGHAGHLSTRQYARLVDEWVTANMSPDVHLSQMRRSPEYGW